MYLGSLDSPDGTRLFDAEAPAVFMPPDRLLSLQGGTLFVRRFDPRSLELRSDPVPSRSRWKRWLPLLRALSPIARGRPASHSHQISWVDRPGNPIGAPLGFALSPELSPDGTRLAFFQCRRCQHRCLVVGHAERARHWFTTDPAVEGFPTWSPDGGRVLFTSSLGRELHWKLASGMGAEHTLWKSREIMAPMDWSPNGFLLFQQGGLFRRDLYALRVSNDAKVEGEPMAIAVDPNFDERDAKFSPDGRWIAYQSNETRRFEIYVVPFPSLDHKIPITSAGGIQVRWRRDVRGLFYIAPDGKLMSVPVVPSQDGKTLKVGAPAPLFPTNVLALEPNSEINGHSYEVSPDASRFLILTGGEGPLTVPVTLILNWKPALK